MVISDEISDFGNMNFKFVSSPMKNDELSPRVRISRTASTKPVSVQKGPRVTEAWISGTEGLFLYVMYPKTPVFVIWICQSNELQMKLCHVKNITKCHAERKILVFFGSLLGIVNLGTKHTQETHTMNLSGELGRKSGFSSESKKIFWWSQISLEISRRRNMTRNEREVPRPVLCRAESKKYIYVCETAEENISWKYLRNQILRVCVAKKRALVADYSERIGLRIIKNFFGSFLFKIVFFPKRWEGVSSIKRRIFVLQRDSYFFPHYKTQWKTWQLQIDFERTALKEPVATAGGYWLN